MATATLPVRPNRLIPSPANPRLLVRVVKPLISTVVSAKSTNPKFTFRMNSPWTAVTMVPSRRWLGVAAKAGSRADESAPFEMSVESALKLLGVTEETSFDEILRAKNSILATCKDDQDTIAQVEAAYDMLLMRNLTLRQKGKVVNSSIRYADVKAKSASGMGSMPKWMPAAFKTSPFAIEKPSMGDLGLQAGVYGALIASAYVNGASTSGSPLSGPDIPGLILASSFGASLYFLTKKNVKPGKATLITIGGVVAGAVVGTVVENWLQVDIVPILGIHSPAAVVSEFILFSQLLVSLYLR